MTVRPIRLRTPPGLSVGAVAGIFRMLADRTRLALFLTLARGGERNVTALCEAVGGTQPAVSHSLGLLLLAGLVTRRRQGRFNFYAADADAATGLAAWLAAGFAPAGRQPPPKG